MPTVLRFGPYRFFFYASDRDELVHIHIGLILPGSKTVPDSIALN